MKKVVKKTRKELLNLQLELLENLKKLLLSGFGLVAALAWNDAIKKLFEIAFPEQGSGLRAMFMYAVLVTLVVVLVTYYLSKFAEGITKKIELEKGIKNKKDKKKNSKK